MARGNYFLKLRLKEYTAHPSLCLCQYPPEISYCSRNRISVSSGKGLNFITNYIFLVTEHIPLKKMMIGTTSKAEEYCVC